MTMFWRVLVITIMVSMSSGIRVANAQVMSLIPKAAFGQQTNSFLAACLGMDQWPSNMSVTT